MHETFLPEVEKALKVLESGGVILYPTDTIWGLGCDAMNNEAVQRIYQIKGRADSKSMILLVADEKDILQYVAAPDPELFIFLEEQHRPTTVIYSMAIHLPENLVAPDGSIAMRIVKDDFCRHLVKRLKKPIVSTSANISGHPSPKNFRDIDHDILNQVDYVVGWRQNDEKINMPSQILRWLGRGKYEWVRR